MSAYQAFRDGMTAVAGGRPARSAQPGEVFELPESHRKQARIQQVMLAQATRILFAVGFLILVL